MRGLERPSRIDVIPTSEPVKTPAEWEKLIKNEFNYHKKMLRKYRHKEDGISLFDFTDNIVKRRQKALLDTMPEIYKRYSAPEGYQRSLAEIWINLNTPFVSYAQLDANSHILYAASIWMLDQISCQENWREVYRYLPTDDAILDKLFLHDEWDSQHEYDLIYSVEHVLHHRNPVETDAQDYDRVVTSDLLARGTINKDDQDRKNYEGLLSLIPQDAIDEAVERFRAFFWQWTDRFFASTAPFMEKTAEYDIKIRDEQIEYNKTVDEVNALIDRVMKQEKKTAAGPLAMNAAANPAAVFDTRARDAFNFGPSTVTAEQSELVRLTVKLNSLFTKIDKDIQSANELYNAFRNYGKHMARVGRATRNEAGRYDGITTAPMEPMQIDNPFEMCFALLYLAESNDNLPWLYGAGCGLMGEVIESLPWGILEYDELDDDVWCEAEEDGVGEDTEGENAEDAQTAVLPKSIVIPNWYERKYRMRGDDFDFPRSLAQILYEETGCVLPRYLHIYDNKAKLLAKYGIKGKDAAAMLVLMSTLGSVRRSMKAHNLKGETELMLKAGELYEESSDETAEEPPKVEKPDLEALKAENKRLKAALHAADIENRDAKKTITAMKTAAALEHRELADLREYVFNQDQGTEETVEETPNDEIWPYEVQRDTVVFGGHATWTRGIKSILAGNIRFIDKDLVFDTEIVKHADVIWIQPNAISHPMYWRVVDTARVLKKPVRYFAFASWVKCADQVVKGDT